MHDTTDFLMQLTLLLLKLSFLDELHHRGGFYNNFQMKIINYNKFFIYQKNVSTISSEIMYETEMAPKLLAGAHLFYLHLF